METVPCDLCGSSDHRTLYSKPDEFFFPEEWFTVVECRACSLVFTNPRPNPVEMARYYPPAFFDFFEKDTEFQARRYQREAGYVTRAAGAGTGKRLLDVGCANGDFPRYMKGLGWEVEGIEVSPAVRPTTDFPVHTVELPCIPVHGARYDVVTAWAVMEHVHRPRAYFAKAAELLKPGGAFVFLVTNSRSLSSRCLFREDLPRHLYFFDRGTIQKYLSSCGLSLEDADFNNRIYSMQSQHWMHYLISRLLYRKPFLWSDRPPGKAEFYARWGLEDGRTSTLRYLLQNPLTVLDYRLAPLVERLQMLLKTYGIVTYTARKPAPIPSGARQGA